MATASKSILATDLRDFTVFICILFQLLWYVQMATGLDTRVVSRTCFTDPFDADPSYQPVTASLMIQMASEIEYRLVTDGVNEWVEDLTLNGWTVSGALRCNRPAITTVTDCQTCINAAKDILTTQFCATKWNSRVTLADCIMRFSYFELSSVDDPDYTFTN